MLGLGSRRSLYLFQAAEPTRSSRASTAAEVGTDLDLPALAAAQPLPLGKLTLERDGALDAPLRKTTS